MCARISKSSKSAEVSEGNNEADAGLKLEYLAATLRRVTLQVVWRQWRALGAAAASRAGQGDHDLQALIDPEALLLVSLVLMHDERRLVDLLHDWGARNSDLLSVQRVKNLAAAYPAEIQNPLLNHLTWFATIAINEGKDLRWRSVVGDAAASLDPVQPRSARGKIRSTRARLTSEAALTLRLRLGFGVGVRADMLAYLLARVQEWATVREISEAV